MECAAPPTTDDLPDRTERHASPPERRGSELAEESDHHHYQTLYADRSVGLPVRKTEATKITVLTTEARSRAERETHGGCRSASTSRQVATSLKLGLSLDKHRAGPTPAQGRREIPRGRQITSTVWIERVLVIRRPLAIPPARSAVRPARPKLATLRASLCAPCLRGEYRDLRPLRLQSFVLCVQNFVHHSAGSISERSRAGRPQRYRTWSTVTMHNRSGSKR